jgi:hypothetical protein
MLQTLFQNPVAVFWVAIASMVVVPAVTAAVAGAWYKTRKSELDASVKMRMLEMGMSADDIVRVLKAESGATETETV